MLRVANLAASYGGAPVLQGVALHVERGETVALLGPNGAGKSTLLGAITATIPVRRGEIRLEDQDLISLKSHDIVSQGVALVPEGRLVFGPFSVADNLRLGAVRLKGDVRERYDFVYGLFPRLAERRTQAAGTLSGGGQQKAGRRRAPPSAARRPRLPAPGLGAPPRGG